jgi:hypothetical protein
LVVVAGLVLAAGCTNGTGSIGGGEPFFGGLTPRAASPGGSNALDTAAGAPSGGVPGLPTATSATSQAALVGGVSQSGDARHDLRATDQPAAPASKSSSWGPQGATLSGPQQDNLPSGALSSTPVRLTSGGGTTPAAVPAAPTGDTFEHLMEELRKRGATWWRLEPMVAAGKYRFVCSVRHADNPNSGTRYDATSVNDNGLGAIRAVIDQIDRQRPAH